MYAVVDIETTGSFYANQGITEIAIVLYDGSKVIEKFETLVNPKMPIPAHITGLTSIDDAMVREAPEFSDIAQTVFDLLEGNIFVAHNVHFDFNFVAAALERSGLELKCKKLCTVRLSRKVIPGLSSYSLGALAESLNIPIKNRHRAMGDTLATVALLEYLLVHDLEDAKSLVLAQLNKKINFPSKLKESEVKALPELPGIYFFKNDQNEVIYVGKAVNIKKRVIGHFTGTSKEKRNFQMREEIASIGTELAGNELMALLLESNYIRSLWPKYNRAQKFTGKKYGFYLYHDAKGYQRLTIAPVKKGIMPAVSFSSRDQAQKILNEILVQFVLCPKFCGLQKTKDECFHFQDQQCNGACGAHEPVAVYNARLKSAIGSCKAQNGSFFIEGRGPETHLFSIIWVQNGKFMGYNYLDIGYKGNYDYYKNNIKSLGDDKDYTLIISKIMNTKNFETQYELIPTAF